ncbi:glycine cleavage system T protein [Venturia nashicola]|uniref:Aminomethyltransferase n=1 Tax=Venturia nashicola TaxID=86259 RepID=A0A4Z1P145_9PEZI|nr:glycine cleavage system T protein [Venturia nashicola]
MATRRAIGRAATKIQHARATIPPVNSASSPRTFVIAHQPRPARQSAFICKRQERVHQQKRTYASSVSASKTQLYDFHVNKGGKMVPFGGFLMPLQYADLSIVDSHHWTREKASIFDVSHMLQHELTGPGAANFLASITPSSPKTTKPFHSGLSALLHPTGGIVDDTIITNLSSGWKERYYFVTNAGCRDKDLAFIQDSIHKWREDNNNGEIQWRTFTDYGLVALQGPLSADILKSLKPTTAEKEPFNVDELHFGQCKYLHLAEIDQPCLVSRGGYTGEDGFEISVPSSSSGANNTLKLTEALLQAGGEDKVRLAGLGARDSLRLEAGMCLYGHDIDDSTTPVEAGLSWIVATDRREVGGFNGSDTILSQLKPKKDGGSGVTRRRVGLIINDKAPAREGASIVNEDGQEIGTITSGCPSPTLGKNIAMGYIKSGMHKAGTEVGVVVRNKTRRATVSKMPFVPSKYWKGLSAGL